MNQKVLELQFSSSSGKNRTFKVNEARDGLDPLTVTEAMDQIIAADAFAADGDALYIEIKGARYVERIVTPILEN